MPTPNPYEAPACQRVKRSRREASDLAHGSSDRDPRALRAPDLISGGGFCRRCLHQTPIEGQASSRSSTSSPVTATP
jgi:hypothetical protein